MRKTVSHTFLLLLTAVTYAQSYLPKPGTMDKITIYGFSQHWNFTVVDTQIFHTSPDIIIRGWSQWDKWGDVPSDYNSSIVPQYHDKNVKFVGGVTGTVYFFDQATDSAEFKDMVTRDASGNLVPHNNIAQGAYRGNIANPAFRNYIVNRAKLQIDAGVDGIFYDEAISSYAGLTFNGNEGYDDYTLKDFNAFLAAKYPKFSKNDWISKFAMAEANYINIAQPLDDLNKNFNYRKYLAAHRWQNNPLTSSNPLAAEWGKVLDNRPDTASNTFLSKYTTKYWRDIITQTRQYARDAYRKEILITSNGLFPYVDFNSVGMYNGNHDNNGAEANYVPAASGHLQGSVSLQNTFKILYQKSRSVSGLAPVVLFIDWPTQMMTDYYNFSLKEKMDYWRIYAAEAYANGLSIAFHLRTAFESDPTATSMGILDFLRDYPAFYRQNAPFYHNNQILNKQISVTQSAVSSSLMIQHDSGRFTLHLVNHNYVTGEGMTKKAGFTVLLNLDSVPKSVYMKSPDFAGYREQKTEYSNGNLTITVDSLYYYDVIVLDYKSTVTTTGYRVVTWENLVSVFPNPSEGQVTIQPITGVFHKELIIGIYDDMGRSVRNLILKGASSVNLTLSAGVYYLKCSNGENIGMKKLLVF